MLPTKEEAHEVLGGHRFNALSPRTLRITVHPGQKSPRHPLVRIRTGVISTSHCKALVFERRQSRCDPALGEGGRSRERFGRSDASEFEVASDRSNGRVVLAYERGTRLVFGLGGRPKTS